MSDLRDPPRWLSRKTLEPELRRDLLAYGSAAPSGERRARMLAQLEDELGALDGTGSAGALFSSSQLKLALAAGALVMGSLALLALLWPPAQAHKERLVRSPVIVFPTSGSELREPDVRQVPIVSASAPSVARSASPTPEPAHTTRPPRRREQRVDKQPAQGSGLEQRAAPQASALEQRAAPQASGAFAELTLLARARRALLVQPERALALAEQHARSYPSGTFREEREVLAIESLAKLSRIMEARQRVRVFDTDFPSSTHRAHLAQLVSRE